MIDSDTGLRPVRVVTSVLRVVKKVDEENTVPRYFGKRLLKTIYFESK